MIEVLFLTCLITCYGLLSVLMLHTFYVCRNLTSTFGFESLTPVVSRAAIKQGIRPLDILPARPPGTQR